MSEDSGASKHSGHHTNWFGVGRAVGGAILFGLPLMMTMEMWSIGLHIEPLRLLSLLLISLPVLVCVARLIGFKNSRGLLDDVIDVFVAYIFAFIVSCLALFQFNILTWGADIEINFKIVLLQTIPASFGALLGRSELGSSDDNTNERSGIDRLAVLAIGAVYFSLNIAPTEEIQLIAFQMTPWHLLALFCTTILIMHSFSASESFREHSKKLTTEDQISSLFYTGTATVVALGASLLMLWIFGRTDGLALSQIISNTVVLFFPAGIGATAARLIL